MNIASLLVSLVALAISLATYRRAREASRREQLLWLQQRRQDGLLAALKSEFALQRSLTVLSGVEAHETKAKEYLEQTKNDISHVIADVKAVRCDLEALDYVSVPDTETQVRLERIMGRLEQLFHKSAEIENKARTLTTKESS